MGLELLAASLAAGGTLASSLTAVYGTFGAAVIRLGISLLANTAIGALFAPSRSQQDLSFQLGQLSSRVVARNVYGRWVATGTPVPSPVVGDWLYQAWVLNSRESHGNFTVYFDGREVETTGDIHDFTDGGGATATGEPFLDHATVWITKGDKTAPPYEFTDEAGYVDGGDWRLWKTSSAARGLTVLYAKIAAGDAGRRRERWPNGRPRLTVKGDFSLIYNSREAGHDPDDKTTWEFSRNPIDIARDVLQTNPFAPFASDSFHIATIEGSAAACDEAVTKKEGGTEPRFQCDGVVSLASDSVEQLIDPILKTAAARAVRVGGKMGFIAGVARTPTGVVSNSLDGMEFSTTRQQEGRYTQVRAKYSPEARANESADVPSWDIPGALTKDNGKVSILTLDLSMVTQDAQAQRLRNIYGYSSRQQRTLSSVSPATALDFVGGSIGTLELPSPYDQFDGTYELQSINPLLDWQGESGVAMRLEMIWRGHANTIYDWTAATDEEVIDHLVYTGPAGIIAVPGTLTAASGDGIDIDLGTSVAPRIRIRHAPSSSPDVLGYAWQYRVTDVGNGAEDNWQDGQSVSTGVVNGSGDVEFYHTKFNINDDHDFRSRTVTSDGTSGWVVLSGHSYGFTISGADVAVELAAVRATGTAPNVAAMQGVRVWRAASGAAFSTAVDISGILAVAPGAAFDLVIGDADATNLVTNGDFADGSDWTGLDWTIGSGIATHTGTGGTLEQLITMTESDVARITFDVVRTAGSIRAHLRDTALVTGAWLALSGTYSETLTVPAAAGDIEFEIDPNTGFVGSVDNVIIVIDSAEAVEQGPADFFTTPVSLTGTDGAEDGPFSLIIP